MRWRKRGRRGPGDSAEPEAWAELDARLSETWEAATTAVGGMLDLAAGKEALLASSRLPQENADALQAVAGLTGRNMRRHRRRLLVPAAAGVAALAASAVALTVIGVPGAGHGGAGGQAVDTAYVLRQVGSALSAADSGEIAQMTVTSTAPTSAEEWSYHGQWHLSSSANGKLALDMGFSTSSGYTVVNYQQRKWAHVHSSPFPAPGTSASASGPGGCGKAAADLSWLFQPGKPGTIAAATSLPATVTTALRAAISCGTLTVVGRQRVNGTDAIELTSRPGIQLLGTVWVSPGTYLPVRVVVRQPLRGNVIKHGLQYIWSEADIVWLPPTARNLARLTVLVPAGFRQVSPARVTPLLGVGVWVRGPR